MVGPILLLATVALVRAQSDGDHDLSWWTVDGGGATFSHGGGYTLGGGFWGGGAAAVKYEICLPLVLRNF